MMIKLKKRQVIISVILICLLFFSLKKVLAANKAISVININGIDANISYNIAISDEETNAAQDLDLSCPITTWTLNTGYGKNDSEAVSFDSTGNTSNAEKPISQHQSVFNEQNGYDVLHSNGFDRVMLEVIFIGKNGDCQIRYPIVTKPVLFSEFPYKDEVITLTQTPTP
jgi:hypothetical protein